MWGPISDVLQWAAIVWCLWAIQNHNATLIHLLTLARLRRRGDAE